MKLKGRRLKYTRKTISGTYSQQNLIYIYIRLNYFHFELVDSYKSLSRIKTKRGERRGEKAKKIQRTILLEVEREREKKKLDLLRIRQPSIQRSPNLQEPCGYSVASRVGGRFLHVLSFSRFFG